MTIDLTDLLKVDDVALLLGKSTRTVRRWVTDGLLKAYRIPGTRGVYFRPQDVRAALEPVQPVNPSEGTD